MYYYIHTSLSSRMDDLYELLKSRNISDDIIQRMQQDKLFMKLLSICITCTVPKNCHRETLEQYIMFKFSPVEVLKLLCLVSF